MTRSISPTILIVPGLRDHVQEHWQTILEKNLKEQDAKVRSVPPLEHDKLSCAARVSALDQALTAIDGPVVLAAHSAGVMVVVHWAQRYRREIEGALLATPPDFDSPLPEGYPTAEALQHNGWTPTPLSPLPFPSIVAASTNDPLAKIDRVGTFAQAWGSCFVDLGAVGHLNPASGFGEWPRAEEFIGALCD